MLRSIDRGIFHRAATLGEQNDDLIEIVEEGILKEIPTKNTELLVELVENGFSSDALEKVGTKLMDSASTDVFTDMRMVIDTLNLESSIDNSALYGLEYYDIDTYEDALVYILALVDHSVLIQSVVTLKDVVISCFPIGFYTSKTCQVIINQLIEPKLVEQTDLYHKALEIRH